MKNLKKVLALALAFAMSISMFASAAFTDAASISADHADDVAMLVELGVLGGYPDGSFKPQNTITRAEFTKMAYTIKYGYDDSGKLFAGSVSKFTDVEGVSAIAWAKGYINYCANQGIIGGVGNNKFNPNGNVTVAEAAKMLLVILGCDAAKEGYGGSNWMGNVVADAMELGVFDGWVGDPTAPATRELVATLMSNTLFAPIYVYNPITGVGSQQNPLSDTGADNDLLAEKTMGLERIEGIVVENNAFILNANVEKDGAAFAGSAVNVSTTKNAVDSADPYFVMVEETVDKYGEVSYKSHKFNHDLPAEYLGAEVIVFASTKTKADSRIIGDVVLSADSVIYDVTSSDIRIIPDEAYADLGNTANMLPYVAVDTGDKELQLKPRWANVQAVAGDEVYAGTDLLNYFYFPATNAKAEEKTNKEYYGVLANPTDATHPFYAELAKDGIQGYRAISLDGGKTVAYILRTTTKELTKVGKYEPANDYIQIGNESFYDLEETLVVEGEIARNDDVIFWRENGKNFVAATEEVIGKATIVADNEVTIGGKNYKADQTIFAKTSEYITKGLANYYGNEKGSNTDGSTYIAYNGYLLSAESTGTTVDVSQYAVVLDSHLEDDVPVVTLGFTDESTATFEVSRINNTKFASNMKDVDFKLEKWDGNQFAGRIFRYAINADGTVSLHSDINNIEATGNVAKPNETDLAKFGVITGNYVAPVDESNTPGTITTAEDAVVFAVYGGWSKPDAQNNKYYNKLKVAVYKLADMEGTFAAQNIQTKYTEGEVKKDGYDVNQLSYVNKKDKFGKEAILVSFTSGFNKPVLAPSDNAPLGILLGDVKYVVDAEDEFYANVKMITKDGLVEAATKKNIHEDLFDDPSYGAIVKNNEAHGGAAKIGEFKRNTLVSYNLNDAGEIDQITIIATVADMQKSFGSANAWTYASVASVGSKIKFYNWSTSEINTGETTPVSAKLDDHAFVWVIDGDEAVANAGIDDIATFDRGTYIDKKAYNAILFTENGSTVDQVISFYGRI